MSRVYVGNLDRHVTERELEDEFRAYGVLRNVWVARKPPGFGFVEFDSVQDAKDAIRAIDGKNEWRVELSRTSAGGGGENGSRGRGVHVSDMNCFECGELGHFARECRLRTGARGFETGERGCGSWYQRSPWYQRGPWYEHNSFVAARRSPRSRRSPSPVRRSRSSAARRRSASPAIARHGRNINHSSPPPRRHR